MEPLKIVSQKEVNVNTLSFSINEYQIPKIENEDTLINIFLNPLNFKHQDFHQIIREYKETEPAFLGHPFNLEKINVKDFKIFNKEQMLKFFKENVSPYPNNHEEIQSITNKFSEIVNGYDIENFYVISVDFFDKETNEIGECKCEKLFYDAIIYDVYFLIIWVDFKNMKLIVCQSLSD